MMAGPGNRCNKVIALVDMDCFYCQVEERYDASLKGVPAAVVQYKAWKGGGIIAVNYEARARGVTRNMRGDDAKSVCPEIVLVRVPESNEKADLTKYRDAGKEVVDVLCEFSSHVERASIDEAYIDLTEAVNNFIAIQGNGDPLESLKLIDKTNLENSFPFGFENSESWLKSILSSEILQIDDVKLALGSEIVGRMRRAVYEKTGFRCSAGIAHNKVLAKLGAGFNKPNKQTVIPHESVPSLYEQTKLKKVRSLGGQFGDILVEKFGCEKMSDLLKFTLKQLQLSLGDERGEWLYNLARGYDNEPVTPRQLPQTIGCSKNFMGREALDTKEKANFWISRLCIEVVERIQRDWEMNNRKAKLLTLHVKFKGQKGISRSCGKNNVPYNPDKMASSVMITMEKVYQQFGVLPINNLGLIASKLEEESTKNTKIDSFYRIKAPKLNSDLPSASSSVSTSVQSDASEKEDFVGLTKNITSSNSKPNNEENNDDKDNVDCVILLPISSNKIDTENDDRNINKISGQGDKEKDETKDEVQQIENLRAESIRNEVESTPVKSNNNIFQDENISSEKRKPLFTCSLSPPKIKKFALPQQTLLEMKNITVNGKTLTKQNHGISTSISSVETTPIKNNNNNTGTDSTTTTTNSIDDQVPCCSKSLGLNIGSITESIVVNGESLKSKEVEMTLENENSESCPLFLSNDDDSSSSSTTTTGNKTLAKEYVQHCPRCNSDIPLWDYLSHTDFHVAMDLQNEFNTNNNSSSVTNSKTNNTNSESVVVKEPGENHGGNSSSTTNMSVGSKRPAAQNGRDKGGAKRGRTAASSKTVTTTTTTTSTSAHRQPQMKTLHSYFQPKI